MIRKFLIIVLLSGLFLMVSCDNTYEETSQEFQIPSQTEKEIGVSIRVMLIISGKYRFDSKEKEVRAKLEKIINGGRYNIVSVKTSYSAGRLTAGELTYDSSGSGDGNNLRVLFILSSKYRYDSREKEVKKRLDEIVNGGKYNIVKIQTTYVSGRLLAAEVYYRVEPVIVPDPHH